MGATASSDPERTGADRAPSSRSGGMEAGTGNAGDEGEPDVGGAMAGVLALVGRYVEKDTLVRAGQAKTIS